jgi:hypothetical protein
MCDVLRFFCKYVANRKLVALVMGKYLLLVVFFFVKGPQDKDTIGKVILKTFFFSAEGPQDEDLVWKQRWQVPKLPPTSAQTKPRRKILASP